MIELHKCPFCGKITPVKIATAAEMGDCKDRSKSRKRKKRGNKP